MYPILFEIGSIQIPSFGVMITLGFGMALLVLRMELNRKALHGIQADTIAAAGMIGGILGAKLYFVIEAWSFVMQDPYNLILSGAGFTFFGGFIGGSAAIILVIRYYQQPVLPILDAIGLVIPIGYGIGRIGCQLAGDGDYGMPTDMPWGMAYPNGIVPTTELVHPAPVYETLSAGIIFWVLWKLRRRPVKPGQLFCGYLVLTGFARLIVEFIRINPPVLFGLSDAQIISLIMMAGGGIWWFLMQKNYQSLD